ncbi:MAG: single-stranded-DNA-specific exonuclease RecJ [Hyphomicrobiaceae bacterium]
MGVAVPKFKNRIEPGHDGDPSLFLGVSSSARGYAWRERLPAAAHKLAAAISQQHGLPDLLGRVLAARGVGLDDVATVLDPTIKALLPDPASLRDMDKASARLADAIQSEQRVAIFGDYDVDGASSSALLHRFLAHHGVAARIYIPDRLFEGYGPNATAIEALIAEGAKLIVTVDCGTTSFEPLAAAKGKCDVLVIDHHQADERLPDVHAVVNPNRQDDISGQGHLCAAGVVFLVLVATMKELRTRGFYGAACMPPDLLSDLDIVALATVCDVVPLTGVNRAFVTKGLQVMKRRENAGLKALFDAAGLDTAPNPYHLGFILGPRINAGGRIGDSALGSKLLATHDPVEAARIAAILDKLNKERKAMETAMLEEATAMADAQVEANPDTPLVMVGSPSWHKGLVGLMASRLVDRFKRPACVIAWETNAADAARTTGTGSLRSVAGVDIGGAVRAAMASGDLIKGGGHAMAAGLTVERVKAEALHAALSARIKDATVRARVNAGLEIDGALTPASINDELLALLERAGPYGQGNPTPRFVFPAHRVKFAKIVAEAHVRCTFESSDGSRIEGVAFRAVGQPLGDLLLGSVNAMPIHIAGTVKRDTWQGREKTELMIEDAADPRKQG